MPLNVLIVGAGICGPALGMLLQKANPQNKITIIERSPSLRSSGQQVDLKTQAPHILRRMGLMDEVESRCVNETGVEIVDYKEKRIAYFGANAAGESRPGLTSEHEIMRGDIVQVLYDASMNQDFSLRAASGATAGLTYEFGRTITALHQAPDGVDVSFSNGQLARFDLLVAADGQASRTRRLAFGKEISDAAFKSFGIHGGYFSIPRIRGEGSLARGHLVPESRMIVTRTSDRPVTGVLLFTTNASPKLKAAYKVSLEKQKEAFIEIFEDSDWQADRLMAGLAASDDFYAHELGQIKMDRLSTGRVVLLGDAGYCPSPFTGLGTNLCLVGAYVLAGELTRQRNDIMGALRSYEETMRPFIDNCQRYSRSLGLFFPSSRLGVWSMHRLMWAVSKMSALFPPSQKEDEHWKRIPEYPELNLES